MIVGYRLKDARTALGLTQEELGKLLGGKDKQQIYKWESGQVANPSSDMVAKLARILGVTSDYLLGLSDDPGKGYIELGLDADETKLLLGAREGDDPMIFEALTSLKKKRKQTDIPSK